ncbi:hypothetical protein Tco_0556369 [Tanacetum coccineum]
MRVPVDPEAGRFSADEEADKSLPSLTTALQKETCGRQKKSTFEADIVHLEAQEQWSGKQCGKAITGPRCMLMAKKRGSAQLVSGRENLCIEGMKQAGWRMKESGTLNGEGPFRAPPRSIREWLLPYKATDNGGTWFNIAICGTDFKYEKTRADPNTNNWENGNAEMGEKQTRRSGIRVLVELRRTSRETKIFAQWHQDVLVIGEAVQLRKPSGIYQQWWMNEEMKKETSHVVLSGLKAAPGASRGQTLTRKEPLASANTITHCETLDPTRDPLRPPTVTSEILGNPSIGLAYKYEGHFTP